MQTRVRTNAKTAYRGLVHYASEIICRQNGQKRTLCIQITYAEITHFMQKIKRDRMQ